MWSIWFYQSSVLWDRPGWLSPALTVTAGKGQSLSLPRGSCPQHLSEPWSVAWVKITRGYRSPHVHQRQQWTHNGVCHTPHPHLMLPAPPPHTHTENLLDSLDTQMSSSTLIVASKMILGGELPPYLDKIINIPLLEK